MSFPDYPFWPNSVLEIDPEYVEESARRYCQAGDQESSGLSFVFGDLALTAAEQLSADVPAGDGIEAMLGSLYLSGYFGGIWLRRAVFAPGETGSGEYPEENTDTYVRSAFDRIVARAGEILVLAREGGGEEVVDAARANLPQFLSLYGYNRGYLEEIIAHCPPELGDSEDLFSCGNFFDCGSSRVTFAPTGRYSETLAQLHESDEPEWEEMRQEVVRWGEGAMDAGRGIWEVVLADTRISLETYELLVDLSAGYLLFAQVSVISAMTAWVDRDAAEARCALLLQAGLTVWSQSYFLGLVDPNPPAGEPELVCEE